MTRLSRISLALAAALPLLAACGEGWVMQPIRNITPYTEGRTAGPGVAYVRAHMLPEKGPVLAPVLAPASVQLDDAAPIFESRQGKTAK